jgi:hypothetical protein
MFWISAEAHFAPAGIPQAADTSRYGATLHLLRARTREA